MTRDAASATPTWIHRGCYDWMNFLPKPAWGWELLRRNPNYRNAYQAAAFGQSPATTPSAAQAISTAWTLCRFEDPERDARQANTVWLPQACREVLPLVASAQHYKREAGQFALSGLLCRVTIHRERDGERCHVLFAQDGRFLQLEVCGAAHLEDGVLLTPVLAPPHRHAARLLALRRLTDLMLHRCLRPCLYPPYRRRARFIELVRALDGEMAGASQRDIAVALLGHARVERNWHDSHNPLRDHVRRTLDYGHLLMESGYRRLLA